LHGLILKHRPDCQV